MTKFNNHQLNCLSSDSQFSLSVSRLTYFSIDQQSLEKALYQPDAPAASPLNSKIAALEAAGKTKEDLKIALQTEKKNVLIAAINQVLRQEKSTDTYASLSRDPSKKAQLDAYLAPLDVRLTETINRAIDDYYNQKQLKSGSIAGALRAIPPATTRQNLDATNPEIKRLEELRSDREQILENSQQQRAMILRNEALFYNKTMTDIDSFTSPDSQYEHGIKDYDDGFTGKATDQDNPTRNRLNGYLYANYLFMGGGQTGMQAAQNRVEEAYKLYHSSVLDSRFTMNDLTSGMGMEKYLKDAEQYSKNDRLVGLMAGQLKLLDDNVKDSTTHARFEKYLREQFEKVKVASNEKDQLQILFGIKSLAEFLNIAPDWRNDFNLIDTMTDPDKGSKIKDYPGTGSDNRNNPTRLQLNGFLYAQHLFAGGGTAGQKESQLTFDMAYKMYDEYGADENIVNIGDHFSQEYLEREYVENKTSQPGFGLGPHLDEAKTFTTFEQPKGVVAGLLRLANQNLTGPDQKVYLEYLRAKFAQLSRYDSEESQLMYLSSIKTPAKAVGEVNEELRVRLVDLMIEATKQHSTFKFTQNDVETYINNQHPVPGSSLPSPEKIADFALQDMKDFIQTESDRCMKKQISLNGGPFQDNPHGLNYKYNLLVENNSKLKKPVYSSTDLAALKAGIDQLDQQFDSARDIARFNQFDLAVTNQYLRKLSDAQKVYFDQAEELDKKLSAIDQQAQKPNSPTASTGGAPTGPGAVPLPTPPSSNDKPKVDSIESAWDKAEEVDPAMGNYSGDVTVNTANLNARDDDGHPVKTFPQGTDLFRSAQDVVLRGRKINNTIYLSITDGANHYWVAEKFLTTKPEPSTPKTPETPLTPPEKPPVSPQNADFEQFRQRVETTPDGVVFPVFFNGENLPCRCQKAVDGYHLVFQNGDVFGDLVFPTMEAFRIYLEAGQFYQYANTQMLQEQKVWDRYQDPSWVDSAVKVERRGPFDVFVELDWKRNNAFEKGNVKCNFTVDAQGKINYRLEKDYIGPTGENIRTGQVSDFKQLIEMLSHCKVWSESYQGLKGSEQFPAIQQREQLLTAMMDYRTYDQLGVRLGEKYNFQNFYNQGYAYMDLNWDQQQDFFRRNQSPTNPHVEFKLNPDNSVSYRITNSTGPNGSRLGCYGTVANFDSALSVVTAVRQDPKKYLIIPANTIPRLG